MPNSQDADAALVIYLMKKLGLSKIVLSYELIAALNRQTNAQAQRDATTKTYTYTIAERE